MTLQERVLSGGTGRGGDVPVLVGGLKTVVCRRPVDVTWALARRLGREGMARGYFCAGRLLDFTMRRGGKEILSTSGVMGE